MNPPTKLYCGREFESDALSPPGLVAYETRHAAFAAALNRVITELGDVSAIEICTHYILIKTLSEVFRVEEFTIFEIGVGVNSVWNNTATGTWETPYAVHSFVKVDTMLVEEYVCTVTNVNKIADDNTA